MAEKLIQQVGLFDHRFYSRAILTDTKPGEEKAVIPRASFDRYVRKLKALSDPSTVVGEESYQERLQRLQKLTGLDNTQPVQQKVTFSLGFTEKLRDFTTFQVFLICWVCVLSRDQRLSLDSLAARLNDGDHTRIYEALNDARGREKFKPFYDLFKSVIEYAQAKEQAKAAQTTLA